AGILQRSELGQQVMELVDETEAGITQLAPLALLQRRHLLAGQPDFPGAGRIQPAEHVQQGGLARTRAADDGNALARPQTKIDGVEDLQALRPDRIVLAQLPAFQNYISHNAGPPPVRYGMHARLDRGLPESSYPGRRCR